MASNGIIIINSNVRSICFWCHSIALMGPRLNRDVEAADEKGHGSTGGKRGKEKSTQKGKERINNDQVIKVDVYCNTLFYSD